MQNQAVVPNENSENAHPFLDSGYPYTLYNRE